MQDFPIFDSRHAHHARLADLRSDTVTRPTEAMYACMREAPVGDDGLDGDPTVHALETAVAAMLGKDAGLYVPTCTMANLLAVLAHTQRHEQVLLESSAHMFTTERGGSLLAGLAYTPIEGKAGAMDLDRLEAAVRPGSHRIRVGLIAMETSHNNAGGAVLPLAHMQGAHQIARGAGVSVHIDGARLMNAAAALNLPAATLAQHAESVSLCLSKGLSAPVGAVLAASDAAIARARAYRKMLGGTQRQAGIMAAAGLEALRTMSKRLADDHAKARVLSTRLNALGAPLPFAAGEPQTNIVQVHVGGTGMSSHQWVKALAELGVLTRPWGEKTIRCVTHRHIDDADISHTVDAFAQVLEKQGQA
ncbi:low specificity L-threonine aldolase (plasmid) [Paraburkholderia sprentiae WSM5005]|uniref:Low specificity L-threonine aldolase n=1 Tax=Paraburkholderia sprentiae WSM5005 TaxID=754502 RepID=A0A1I9YTX6_9BURK|nr:GntG family PLP-dependent aldolase [Paraburkholderia sprentiae]APA89667.1 low specificity L-threonine aldolase [Paraburkholderia sprentiae WSM5005]